jgi:hypothetical protein
MAVRSELYTRELIDAIDDWQAGSRGKERKAARLIKVSRHLPESYRTVPAEVFRQLRANARLAVGVAFDAMTDFVSSWTTSLDVAKHFRESDGDRTKVLMIFRRRPAAGDVILDLNVVYADPDFMDTVQDTEKRFSCRFNGIGSWQNGQCEVVLNETVMCNDDIISLGAFRDLDAVLPRLGIALVPEAEVRKELGLPPIDQHFWTSPETAADGIRNAAGRIQAYLKDKRLWPDES